MRKIEAVIKPFKLEEVTNELNAQGISGMTITDVKGYGRQKGHAEGVNIAHLAVDFIPKIKLEIVVRDCEVERVVSAILKSAKTGQVGDGKIFISPIQEAIRIRTNESDEEAL